MSDVRALIRAKMHERNLNMRDLSVRVLRKNQAYLHQFLERGVPKNLDEDDRAALAAALGVSPSALKGDVNRVAPQHLIVPQAPARLDDTLRVLGMAEGGADGWAMFNGEVIEYIPRPANLSGVPDAYAVYITGSSMEDRYHPGELVHIHPHKPVTPGAYVLVQKRPTAPGEPPLAVVKRLVKRSGDRIVLEQTNPRKTFELKAADVVSIHRVVGSSEA